MKKTINFSAKHVTEVLERVILKHQKNLAFSQYDYLMKEGVVPDMTLMICSIKSASKYLEEGLKSLLVPCGEDVIALNVESLHGDMHNLLVEYEADLVDAIVDQYDVLLPEEWTEYEEEDLDVEEDLDEVAEINSGGLPWCYEQLVQQIWLVEDEIINELQFGRDAENERMDEISFLDGKTPILLT
jgi:hypothetical protein